MFLRTVPARNSGCDREPEVCNLDGAAGVEKNVGGLQVAIQYPCTVHFFNSENLEEIIREKPGSQGPTTYQLRDDYGERVAGERAMPANVMTEVASASEWLAGS